MTEFHRQLAGKYRKPKRIIVIGLQNIDDRITLDVTAEFLEARGDTVLAKRLRRSEYEEFDMSTKPEQGDAFDHIDENTALVVALHLFGIDHTPLKASYDPYTDEVFQKSMFAGICYRGERGRNSIMLERCMELKVPLVCWGDQPWRGVQKKTQIHENSLWIYEPDVGNPTTQRQRRQR